mgnify:CR=1 FL=1
MEEAKQLGVKLYLPVDIVAAEAFDAEANAKKSYTNESPEFLAEEEEFKNKLLQAIQKLNETQRVAFLMHRIDGKKYAQIADELGISIKAVEKRIQIALQELRKEFDYFR